MTDLTLPGETRVAVAGDWHGNTIWIQEMIPALHAAAPEVGTILHAGDFGILPGPRGKGFLAAVDAQCEASVIERVLVTPGNHDDWTRMNHRFVSQPGEAIRLSDRVWVLPRGFRFTLAGRTFLSFGVPPRSTTPTGGLGGRGGQPKCRA
ncbi:metallophosphoesterase [Conyzicola nivalis]|uniref:metallophosphoesterase n=1 Tax=Conyzicola nivalis TaxID=1477021 RepID=UPI003397EB72